MQRLARCQCDIPCKNLATQEDLLCDMCRDPDWACLPTCGGRLTSTDTGSEYAFAAGHMWVQFARAAQ